ncbi:MAG: macro domain-containing protein [Phycisphaeraceae bacterium]
MDLPVARVEVVTGDITQLHVEAIVNAANTSLLGGGGVDGAIHRAAGPALLEHNRNLGGCQTGLAVVTPSFELQQRGVRHIIHAVGPVWSEKEDATQKLGNTHADVLLASCYHTTLGLCAENHIGTVAFPAISTGVYGFPKERAAKIAVAHTLGWLAEHDLPRRVIFCCYSDADANVYRKVIESRGRWMNQRTGSKP